MLRYSESIKYNTTFQNMNEKDVNMPIKKDYRHIGYTDN